MAASGRAARFDRHWRELSVDEQRDTQTGHGWTVNQGPASESSAPIQPLFFGEYDPLWGDLDDHEPIIDLLLRAIERGSRVEIEGDLEFSDHGLTISVRFLDGATWSVRQVWRGDLSSEGNRKNCLPVPDHWHLVHRGEVIASEELTDWFKRVEEYMPAVEPLEFPESAAPGEPLTISGPGHHEGERGELTIEFSDGTRLALDEVLLGNGAFRWQGSIPDTAPTCPAKVTILVLDGTEVVWSRTSSPPLLR